MPPDDIAPRRLVAVLGYSSRRGRELHPICLARIEHAADVTRDGDAVVLTGGGRRSLGRPEAEAMRDAWPGPATGVIVDDAALSTADNAAHVRDVALELGVEEVVVVTSSWHNARAAALFRRAFRGTGIRVTSAPAATDGSPSLLAREAVCFIALPVQLWRAGRATGG